MNKILLALLVPALLVVAVACGGGGDNKNGSTKVFIEPANADKAAHAAMPTADELPGDGWEVTARDEFDEDDGSGFLAAIEGLPQCETLSNLASLEDLFGADTDDDEPAGIANIEFERSDRGALLPTGIQVEVEIAETASDVQGGWVLVKQLFESKETTDCFVAMLNRVFGEEGAGFTAVAKAGKPSASAPQDGASMAFDVQIMVATLKMDMALELYFWPYGNAQVQVMFMGDRGQLNGELVGATLRTIDGKVVAAEKAN